MGGKKNYKKDMEQFLSKPSNKVLRNYIPSKSRITFGNSESHNNSTSEYECAYIDEMIDLSPEEIQRMHIALKRTRTK